jgi:hypothetical protein
VADVSRKSDRELRKIVTRADQVVKALPGADEAVRSGRARALLDEAHEALGDAKVARTELTRRKEEASLVERAFQAPRSRPPLVRARTRCYANASVGPSFTQLHNRRGSGPTPAGAPRPRPTSVRGQTPCYAADHSGRLCGTRKTNG